MTTITELPLGHLRRLTGPYGLFEHARFDSPRPEHGYTVDDNTRALVLLSTAGMSDLDEYSLYLKFVLDGRSNLGWRNRMSAAGTWSDVVGPDDTTGRAFWALGSALASGREDHGLLSALGALSCFSSVHLRANSYALLGAAETLKAGFMVDAMVRCISTICALVPNLGDREWPWPEKRLTYDNARIPHALIVAGAAIDDHRTVELGLALLDWLLETESGPYGFSFTPVAGRGPGDKGPAFDQQPLEAWAMADACSAAAEVTGDRSWNQAAYEAAMWFHGRNDVGAVLFDPVTGAGFDGLHRDGVNQNRGAESTLSALGAQVHFDRTS